MTDDIDNIFITTPWVNSPSDRLRKQQMKFIENFIEWAKRNDIDYQSGWQIKRGE